jgi:hypothetical protein
MSYASFQTIRDSGDPSIPFGFDIVGAIGVGYFGAIVTSLEDPISSIGSSAPRRKPYTRGILGDPAGTTLTE